MVILVGAKKFVLPVRFVKISQAGRLGIDLG